MAWYQAITPGIHERTVSRSRTKSGRSSNKSLSQESTGIVGDFMATTGRDVALGAGMMASRYAAKSQLTGSLGVALRVGGRVGLRVIPVVGVALFAYDMYQFGKWLAE